MKRNDSTLPAPGESADLRLREAIPDGRRQAGESASAEARYVLRRAIIYGFMWQTERKANTTLH